MLGWIQVKEDLPDQAKLRNFRRLLGLKTKAEAIGYMVLLWLFTFKMAWRDGNLEPWGEDGIEEACGWPGSPGELVKALRDCGKQVNGARGAGFLDGFNVHDWQSVANLLIRNRLHREGQAQRQATPAPARRPRPANPARPAADSHRPSAESYRERARQVLKERGLA